MKIVTYPSLILKKTARSVTEFGIWSDVIDQMVKLMVENKGVGLAANQVGLDIDLFVMQVDKEMPPKAYFNCQIRHLIGEPTKMQEACLSLPSVGHEITRYPEVVVQYYDKDGKFIVEDIPKGLASQCAQHEMDHLKGILYIDHLDMIKKGRIIKQYSRINFGKSKCT